MHGLEVETFEVEATFADSWREEGHKYVIGLARTSREYLTFHESLLIKIMRHVKLGVLFEGGGGQCGE